MTDSLGKRRQRNKHNAAVRTSRILGVIAIASLFFVILDINVLGIDVSGGAEMGALYDDAFVLALVTLPCGLGALGLWLQRR